MSLSTQRLKLQASFIAYKSSFNSYQLYLVSELIIWTVLNLKPITFLFINHDSEPYLGISLFLTNPSYTAFASRLILTSTLEKEYC